jgi:hypothetical protein
MQEWTADPRVSGRTSTEHGLSFALCKRVCNCVDGIPDFQLFVGIAGSNTGHTGELMYITPRLKHTLAQMWHYAGTLAFAIFTVILQVGLMPMLSRECCILHTGGTCSPLCVLQFKRMKHCCRLVSHALETTYVWHLDPDPHLDSWIEIIFYVVSMHKRTSM